MQALNFSIRGVLGTTNKSKNHDFERNLSPMILNGDQMPGDFPGGMGGFGIDSYITLTVVGF